MKSYFFFLQIFILPVILLINMPCFAQRKTIHFVFDTRNYNAFIGDKEADNDYYEGEVIRHKDYYANSRQLKAEFIKVHPGEYVFYQYDLAGKLVSTGLAKQREKPFQVDDIDVYDSLGQIVAVYPIERYGFSKEGYWTEFKDSVAYMKGPYKANKKDSIWVEMRNDHLEKRLNYSNDFLITTDSVNKIYKSTEEIKQGLLKNWTKSESHLPGPIFFVNSKDGKVGTTYFEFRKDGSYSFKEKNGKLQKGKWDVVDRKIQLTALSKLNLVTIDYLSDDMLILNFEQ